VIDRWAWFDGLVSRCTRGECIEASPALHDAILWLGLRPSDLRAAVGSVLGVPCVRISEPDPRDAARIDGRRLAAVVPSLLRHAEAQVREIGERWLLEPVTAYQLPPATLEHWLDIEGPCGDLLAARVDAEGLALLGLPALERLGRTSTRPNVREAAARWLHGVADDA
jgi:hypothetical protein